MHDGERFVMRVREFKEATGLSEGLAIKTSQVISLTAAIVCVASVMMWDLVEGERPVSHDHTVHYFKAWQLHEHFLSEGRLLGWSHRCCLYP